MPWTILEKPTLACIFILNLLTLRAEDAKCQTEDDSLKMSLGITYGQASQQVFPFRNGNYFYKTRFAKVQIEHLLKSFSKLRLSMLVEPSIFQAEHQLLNWFFIQSDRGPDYSEQRDRFAKPRVFNEYILSFGLKLTKPITRDLSVYALGSIGPMYSSAETERLQKGFAFSDAFALGTNFQIHRLVLDFRISLRHNSNANTAFPNHGHNSVGLESGISWRF